MTSGWIQPPNSTGYIQEYTKPRITIAGNQVIENCKPLGGCQVYIQNLFERGLYLAMGVPWTHSPVALTQSPDLSVTGAFHTTAFGPLPDDIARMQGFTPQ